MTQPRLTIVPVTLAEANAFVAQYHRHHFPMPGHIFSLAVADDAGRIWTIEVNRVATDGCPNACSALYRACWRAARAVGWRKLITYTLPEEGGASLRGAGMRLDAGTYGGIPWSNNTRERKDRHPLGPKHRWSLECELPTDVPRPRVALNQESPQMTFLEDAL